MTEFEKEELKLEDVLKKYEEVIEDLELRIEFLPGKYRDNPILLNNFLKMYSNKLELMKKSKNKPYFARIDFKNEEDEKIDKCYLGKVGVINEDNETITVDWRAPIASVYYDSNVGEASYEAPQGTIKGDLLLKRQYEIEKGKLFEYRDVDTVSNDEILKPYLNANADNRLKNIVASIQSEQNEIIREKMYKNLIVQGVAGSGKTTVALHRVAYLVYNYMNQVKPEQYLVIGPNNFFVNYISGVLPDLDVNNVSQLTYEEISKDLLKEDFEVNDSEDKLIKSIENPDKLFFEKLRTTKVYKNAIDKFIKDYENKIVPNKDLTIKGYKIVPQKIIRYIYNSLEKEILDYSIIGKKIERTSLLVGKYIEDNEQEILKNIKDEYIKNTEGKNKSFIQKERKKIQEIEKEIKNKCNQTLKKHFSIANTKILKLYIEFLSNIETYIKVDDYNIKVCSQKAIENIKNKKVDFEDLAALIYLKYRMTGSGAYENYKHVVIDEAQDYGEFNFKSLKELMPNSTFSIFGDLSQSIYQYRSIDNWEKVIDDTFENKCDIKYLLKSYRTTAEIMNSANNIIESIGEKTAKPVIRHGENVEYKEISTNPIETIKEYIEKSIEKGYQSLAIISKTEEESRKLNEELKNIGIEIENINSSNTKYNGGFCTIPSHLAKGLEFDCVLIADASENKYNSNKLIDMKLLYVAMTRALHELKVLYKNEVSVPLKSEIGNKTQSKIR